MSGRLSTIPNPIEWHDGMLLSPQHFDDLTQRLEGLVEHLAVVGGPFHWGVSRLEIGAAELLDGYFTVQQLEALLPDGFPVWHDDRSQDPLQLALETLEPAFKTAPFNIYVAVPAYTDGSRLSRFVAAPDARQADAEADAGEAMPIPRLQARVQLIASQTPLPSRFSGIPLARVQHRNGAFTLVESFVAPQLKLRGDSPITIRCVGLLRRVREVAIILQQQWRSLSALERESQDVARRNAVQQLIATLPYAEAILDSGEVAPFQVYLTFCLLAGHVASIASDPIPPNFNPYNHANMAASFQEVTGFVEKVLAENTSEDYTGVPFMHGEGSFYLLFEPSWKGRKLVMAMHAPGVPPAQVIAWGEHALIGSSILQDGMRDRRILGARRLFTQREQGLFVGPETVLFELTNDEFVQAGEMLEVTAGPSARDTGKPAEMTLFVMQS